MIEYRPLSKDQDQNKVYQPGETPLLFAADWTTIPIAEQEIYGFAGWYPVVFKKSEQGWQAVLPVASNNHKNVLINPKKGRWMGQRIPHVLRRYPFALLPQEGAENWVLCVDKHCEGFAPIQDQLKEPVIDETGQLTETGEKRQQAMLRFVKSFQRTAKVLSILDEANALIPWQPDWSKLKNNTSGVAFETEDLFRIDEQALSKISEEQVLALHQLQGFKLVYAHRLSLLRLAAMVRFDLKISERAGKNKVDESIVSEFFDDEDDEYDFDFSNL
jgi:hypothetical protein